MAQGKYLTSARMQRNTNYKTDVWIRELFIVFYGVFFLCSLMNDLLPGFRAAHYLLLLAQAVYAPGMLFAAGCLTGMKDPSEPDFRKNFLFKALYSYLCFFILGFIREVFIKHRDVYSTSKDLLAIIRIPNISAVFLTLCFLFLLCAFFWKYIDFCLKHWSVFVIVSIIGFLFLFIPEGILGYGLIGVFIGGDRFNCIPIAYYLCVFLGGILFVRDSSIRLTNKKFLAILCTLALTGVVLAVLRQKHPAVVLLGIVCAYCALIICSLLFPAYRVCESAVIRVYKKISAKTDAIYQKSQENRLINFLLYYLGYCILFLITAYFVFFPYIQHNRTLIWSVDGLGQYVPKVYRFMNYVPSVFQSLLQGSLDFWQYDFTSGLGSTVAISYEPLYWLYLLFKPSSIESAYSFLIILRYFLAGISMSAMLRYFKKSYSTAYLGSVIYAFSGYAIYAGTKHGQFLVPLILLPVLIIAMEELVTKKKWYLLTIFTAISLLCSYYFLYMNTIALGIYFLARILCTKEYRNIKTFFNRGLIIAGSYMIGAAIGSITLFTSFGGYVGSSRSAGESVSSFLTTTPLYYRAQWISDFFISFISDSYAPGLWLKIGMAPIAFLALIFVFTRARKKELKPIFVLLTLFCIIPVFGYIFNGFSNVSNRWCYIYIVAITFIFAEYSDDFHSLTNIEIGVMVGLTAFYGLIIFFSTKYRSDKVFGAFGLLTLTLLFILLLNNDRFLISKKNGNMILFGITVFSVIINANLFIADESGKNTHLSTYVAKGTAMTKMSDTALKYLDQVTDQTQDEEFYRSTNLNTYGNTRSSSLIFGYNDISTFTSTLNGNIVNYNNQMGNCEHNIVSVYSYNFRTCLNELACVRYMGTDQNVTLPLPYGYKKVFHEDTGKKVYSIYENEYALPLGYTYSSAISEKQAEKYSAAEKQELTMTSAIVGENDLAKETVEINSEPSLSVKKHSVTDIDLKNVTMDDGMITIGDGGGSITFHFDGENHAETYLSFCGDIVFPEDGAEHFLTCDILAEDVNYDHKFRVDAYSTGQQEYLFNLGYHKNAINSCTIYFRKAGKLTYDDISIYSQNMDAYEDQVAALSENVLEHVKTANNTVTGDITTTTDKLLVIALPYQNGWTAYVDGKKAELQRVNYQYMGLNLPAGQHHIRLHYRLPGLKACIYTTGAGLMLFLLIILFDVIRKKKRAVTNP